MYLTYSNMSNYYINISSIDYTDESVNTWIEKFIRLFIQNEPNSIILNDTLAPIEPEYVEQIILLIANDELIPGIQFMDKTEINLIFDDLYNEFSTYYYPSRIILQNFFFNNLSYMNAEFCPGIYQDLNIIISNTGYSMNNNLLATKIIRFLLEIIRRYDNDI